MDGGYQGIVEMSISRNRVRTRVESRPSARGGQTGMLLRELFHCWFSEAYSMNFTQFNFQ